MKGRLFLVLTFLAMTLSFNSGFIIKKKEPTPPDVYLNSLRSEKVEDLTEKKYDHLSATQREIFILIKRVEDSPYEFIRNGVSYTGKKAGKHLRWKYSYGLSRIKQAEEFIDHIATKSMKSNKKYLVKLSESEVYPLCDVLYNELRIIREG